MVVMAMLLKAQNDKKPDEFANIRKWSDKITASKSINDVLYIQGSAEILNKLIEISKTKVIYEYTPQTRI